MRWVTSLVGFVRGFYFLLEEAGSYGRLSHRRDSFCLVSHLLTRLSCLKAELFLCEPSSEGRRAAMSSRAPWLREDIRQPCLRKEGLAMPPAALSPSGEDKPCPQEPCSEQETGLTQLWVCLTLGCPESLESGGHSLGPATQAPALL